jgi:hypothetical protein
MKHRLPKIEWCASNVDEFTGGNGVPVNVDDFGRLDAQSMAQSVFYAVLEAVEIPIFLS